MIATIDNIGGGVKLDDQSLYTVIPTGGITTNIPVQGYKKIRFKNYNATQQITIKFQKLDGTEISTVTMASTSWSQYYGIQTDVTKLTITTNSGNNAGLYYEIVA